MRLPEDKEIEELKATIEALEKEKEAFPSYVKDVVKRSSFLSKEAQNLDLRLTSLEKGVGASKLGEQAKRLKAIPFQIRELTRKRTELTMLKRTRLVCVKVVEEGFVEAGGFIYKSPNPNEIGIVKYFPEVHATKEGEIITKVFGKEIPFNGNTREAFAFRILGLQKLAKDIGSWETFGSDYDRPLVDASKFPIMIGEVEESEGSSLPTSPEPRMKEGFYEVGLMIRLKPELKPKFYEWIKEAKFA